MSANRQKPYAPRPRRFAATTQARRDYPLRKAFLAPQMRRKRDRTRDGGAA